MRRISIFLIILFLMPFFMNGEEKKTMTTITKLPKPRLKGKISLEEAISMRRTHRSYTDKSLSLEDLSQLLWAAQGITEERRKHRAVPSAGALYPIEVYAVVGEKGVKSLESGIYQYVPDGHYIRKKVDGDVRDKLTNVAYSQTFFANAPVCFVLTAVSKRTTWKYGNRGMRYIAIEIGHTGQNIQLQAVALGLGSGLVGAFKDEAVSDLLDLKKDESPYYLIPVGYKK